MNESPFLKHRKILVGADYSTAQRLQAFVLSMYNGARFKFSADGLSNFDDQHLEYFCEFARWYHRHGENDPDFMDVCRAMVAERESFARLNLKRLKELEDTSLEDFDGERSDYNYLLDQYQTTYAAHRALGFIE